MITYRFNHRCMSCWHAWYTRKRDAKALCPMCRSENLELYVLYKHARDSRRVLWYGLLGWAFAATAVAVLAAYLAWR